MQQQNKPQRKILVEFTFDWEDYEDVDDELMLEDSGAITELKDGVTFQILPVSPSPCNTEESKREQQIAFYNFANRYMNGLDVNGDQLEEEPNRDLTTDELYDLFLTETKQQA